MRELLDEESSIVSPQPLLLESAVSSDLDGFVEESVKIATRHPELLTLVDDDLNVHGLKKKHRRQQDRHFLEARTEKLEGIEVDVEPAACSAVLEGGRPRMPALAVLVFLLLRGWIGGPKSVSFRLLLKESVTLRRFFDSLGLPRVPGTSTVLDNINAVSEATQQRILQAQLAVAQQDGLDDMTLCRGDSTAVEANSQHPTDSGLMKAFALRATASFDGLAKLKLPGASRLAKGKEVKAACEVAGELAQLCRDIGMLSGKRNVATARKELYLKMYTRAKRLEKRFTPVWKRARKLINKASQRMELVPSRRDQAEALLDQAQSDIEALTTIAKYSEKRVVEEKQTPASDKIYSISDVDAAIIRKGGWEDVFGYRPQLAFSGKGLVTALIVPLGNAADSGQLDNLLQAVVTNTGVLPQEATFDDGYTNTAVRNHYLERGIKVFSFAGANGRHAIGEETYQSEDYCAARCRRATAEANISTLKHSYDLKEVMRRGIGAVRTEMLGKVLAYNLRRLVRLRKEARIAKQRKTAELESRAEAA